ncbi:CBS domain [Musa troglodytarum]|uniref:CBS domain n=1 Tax=Musa troglodytarum TaxID=320322 RepID=A0A9E7ECT2_9LILI|nr:CBS domain [Musa troglodytarum]
MACRTILLQLPSVGAKTPFSSTGGSMHCNHRNSTRGAKMRPSVFSTREDLRPRLDEYPEGIISGEWTENFSLLSYDDLRAYLQSQVTVHKVGPSSPLGEVMSTTIVTAMAGQMLEEIDHHFEFVSALPVVDGELRCVGVISRHDRAEASLAAKTKVGEVMSSPAITLAPEKTVTDAAALMLKKKIHRIPIVNEAGQVIGIVTRTDILEALEAMEE